MSHTIELKEDIKNDKVKLHSAITSLNKCMADYKAVRKTEWKSFKKKIKAEINGVEESIKALTILYKK